MKTKQYWRFVLVLLCSIYLASCCIPKFVSISPEEVEQGDANVQMILTSKCTFFQDTGVDDIIFTPPDGITVHDIIVEDNTTLSFMIDVAKDASFGKYNVVVLFDGNQTITGIAALTMVE